MTVASFIVFRLTLGVGVGLGLEVGAGVGVAAEATERRRTGRKTRSAVTGVAAASQRRKT